MRTMMKIATCWLSAVLLSGCSIGYNRDWDAAAAPPPTSDITGRWTGTWTSEANGHSGPLRALITKTPDGQYAAHYHAEFGGVFSFQIETSFNAQRNGDHFFFNGQYDLGFVSDLFGDRVYKFTGHATPADYTADYVSDNDHGKFVLKRP